MNFAAKQDIEAPAERVWASLTDFAGWERAALRRGAEVTRTDRLAAPGAGMAWQARFDFRGQRREISMRLVEMDPGARMVFQGESRLFTGEVVLDLVEMSARSSRLHVKAEIKPKTLSARIMLQSLKLAKGRVQKRIEARLADFAAGFDGRARTARRV
ncbi:SRPBCC family protein [Neotabrizicola shimadae]|uniref:SRPBCC family protein n=1 Tax=Neotabrizicola shimadae TaxID=2807096 RepID=A0A8G1ECH4_9RHOB|nr:SRPBCC family protein [Neotabrizicola shimadae]QYZ70437.1 SRPBCC family protein [Neotabrizicola shimadae]